MRDAARVSVRSAKHSAEFSEQVAQMPNLARGLTARGCDRT